MAQDLNRLFEDLRRSREVYVTADGDVETAQDAVDNGAREERAEGQPKPRTRLKPDIFGRGEVTVSIADSVFTHAHALALQYPGETGAVGLGATPHTITELIPSGPNAKRSSSSFQLDPDYLQPRLEQAEKRGLFLTAIWHSHPEGFTRPSETDRAAARRMLNDPESGLSGHLYLPISVRTKSAFATRVFVAEGKEATIREVSPIVISSAEHRARRFERSLVAGHLGNLSSTLARAGAPGDARLVADQEALRAAGWTVSLREVDSTPTLRLKAHGITLWLVLPPEYPVSPPDVYAEESTALRWIPVSDTPELACWSSLRSLVTVAEQARKSVEDLRAVESMVASPHGFSLVRRVLPLDHFFPLLKARRWP